MERHIAIHVKEKMGVIDENNRRFLPSTKTIKNHMRITEKKKLHSNDDQERLKEMVRFQKQNEIAL